jgi:hypothetical protein
VNSAAPLKGLANAPRGVNEEVFVVARGFSAEMVDGLVLAGLATVVTETRKVPPWAYDPARPSRADDHG